jgi:peptidoglycan/LPS O-acetylase OafA/YrhL
MRTDCVADYEASRPALSSAPTLLEAPKKDYSNLDLLRACAVLFVFFGHLTHFHGVDNLGPLSLVGLGLWGVLIFFVHTCFVLMLSLERQWRDRGRVKLFTTFMVRRAFRILPLSMLVVALVAIFRLPLMTLDSHHFYGAALSPSVIFSNLLLVQNLTKRVSILGPLWSLPIEMQMYFFLPWLFLLVRPARSIWRLVALWAVSLAFAAMVLHSASGFAWLVRTIPFFLPGVLAYQIQRKKISQLPAYLWPVLIAALTVLFLAGDRLGQDPGLARDYGACLVLGLLVPRFAQISTRWVVATSQIVAKYSYGIYLTHFFSIWLAMEEMSHLPRVYRFAVLVVLSVGLPVLFYHCVEEPMIEVGKKLVDRHVASATAKKPQAAQIRFSEPETDAAEIETY